MAANSVVTKDVAPYSIVAGSPAQLVKYRFDAKVIDELLALKVYDWPPEKLYGAQIVLMRIGFGGTQASGHPI